ncbi:DUF5817 domain-containing protein [Haloplanus sp. GCM10025708]|uniref:DUF5817 domain-containing protein n=1 Tax=Haloferacaceae TaxID=1644056 RepID=UPI0036195BBF
MYAVVGCSDCGALWILADPTEAKTAQCPRCRTRHETRRLERFYRTEDRDAAREARAAMVAEKSGDSEAFDALPSVREMERRLDDAGVDDDEYLTAAGLDADAVADAGDVGGSPSQSRPELVRAALSEGGARTESEIVAYATERGVPAEAARDVLERLTRRGELTESGGEYRLL